MNFIPRTYHTYIISPKPFSHRHRAIATFLHKTFDFWRTDMHFIGSASFFLGFLAVASAQTCNGTTCGYPGILCCSVDEICYTDAYGRPRCSVSSMSVTQLVTTTQIGVWTSAWSEISNGGGGSGSALYTCSSEGSESGAGLHTCASDFGRTSIGMVSLGTTESTSSVTAIPSV